MIGGLTEAAAAFTLALLAPAITRRWNGSWVAPAAILLVTWGLTYGLAALRLLPYRTVGPGTRLLIVAAVALMVLGTQIGQALVRGRAARDLEPPSPSQTISPWWITAYAVCGLCGTIWYVHDVTATMGWHAFADGGRLREALSAGVVSSRFLVLQLSSIVAPLLALAVRLQGGRVGAMPMALAAAAGALTLVSTDRTQCFLLVMTGGFMAAMRLERTVRPASFAAAAAATAGALVVAFLAIGAWTKKAPGDLQLELRWPAPAGVPAAPLPAAVQPFAVLYAYATCSYPALDLLLLRTPAYTGGVHSAYPVVRLLQRAGLYDGPVPDAIAPFVTLVEEPGRPPVLFNTYTFLYYPLEDFGRPGALAYALIVGIAAGVVFGVFRRSPGAPLPLLAASHMATALALTTFVNKFNNTTWWYVVAATALPWLLAGAPPFRRRGTPARR